MSRVTENLISLNSLFASLQSFQFKSFEYSARLPMASKLCEVKCLVDLALKVWTLYYKSRFLDVLWWDCPINKVFILDFMGNLIDVNLDG